jgi:hypothetical protein
MWDQRRSKEMFSFSMSTNYEQTQVAPRTWQSKRFRTENPFRQPRDQNKMAKPGNTKNIASVKMRL